MPDLLKALLSGSCPARCTTTYVLLGGGGYLPHVHVCTYLDESSTVTYLVSFCLINIKPRKSYWPIFCVNCRHGLASYIDIKLHVYCLLDCSSAPIVEPEYLTRSRFINHILIITPLLAHRFVEWMLPRGTTRSLHTVRLTECTMPVTDQAESTTPTAVNSPPARSQRRAK
jgi:hypothetical protein